MTGLDPSWNSQSIADKLAACLLEVYTNLQSAFDPSQQPHYLFTPSHLSQWAAGLQSYSLHGTDLLQACPSVIVTHYVVAVFACLQPYYCSFTKRRSNLLNTATSIDLNKLTTA